MKENNPPARRLRPFHAALLMLGVIPPPPRRDPPESKDDPPKRKPECLPVECTHQAHNDPGGCGNPECWKHPDRIKAEQLKGDWSPPPNAMFPHIFNMARTAGKPAAQRAILIMGTIGSAGVTLPPHVQRLKALAERADKNQRRFRKHVDNRRRGRCKKWARVAARCQSWIEYLTAPR